MALIIFGCTESNNQNTAKLKINIPEDAIILGAEQDQYYLSTYLDTNEFGGTLTSQGQYKYTRLGSVISHQILIEDLPIGKYSISISLDANSYTYQYEGDVYDFNLSPGMNEVTIELEERELPTVGLPFEPKN
jgi:hypothetical protein